MTRDRGDFPLLLDTSRRDDETSSIAFDELYVRSKYGRCV